MASGATRPLWVDRPAWSGPTASRIPPMSDSKPREFFIQGLTPDGKPFRPSDWAERLAGAMSSFRPEGSPRGIASYIGYSP